MIEVSDLSTDALDELDVFDDPVIDQVTSSMLRDRTKAISLLPSIAPNKLNLVEADLLSRMSSLRQSIHSRYRQLVDHGYMNASFGRQGIRSVQYTSQMDSLIIACCNKETQDTAAVILTKLRLLNPMVTWHSLQRRMKALLQEKKVRVFKHVLYQQSSELDHIIIASRKRTPPDKTKEILKQLRAVDARATKTFLLYRLIILRQESKIETMTTFKVWTDQLDEVIYTSRASNPPGAARDIAKKLLPLLPSATEQMVQTRITKLCIAGKLQSLNIKWNDEIDQIIITARDKQPPVSVEQIWKNFLPTYPTLSLESVDRRHKHLVKEGLIAKPTDAPPPIKKRKRRGKVAAQWWTDEMKEIVTAGRSQQPPLSWAQIAEQLKPLRDSVTEKKVKSFAGSLNRTRSRPASKSRKTDTVWTADMDQIIIDGRNAVPRTTAETILGQVSTLQTRKLFGRP